MKRIMPIVLCPQCKGTRRDFNLKHHVNLKCDFCLGRGWVNSDPCKGCGRPSLIWWPQDQVPLLRYCGDKKCLDQLIKIHDTKPTKIEVDGGYGCDNFMERPYF